MDCKEQERKQLGQIKGFCIFQKDMMVTWTWVVVVVVQGKLNSGYILKIKPIGFVSRWHMRYTVFSS